MKRTALIDGDILLVSTGFALEKEVEWEDDVWTLSVDLKEWKIAVGKVIKRIVDDLLASDYVVCLSQGKTFRHDICPTYKGNRKGRKPTGLSPMKEWIIEEHFGKLVPGIEADDTMGILSTHPKLIEGEKIIVSQDKDMMTIPGQLYRDGDVMDISEEEADFWHLYQTLVGDSTDGYPGCPLVGDTQARLILEGNVGYEAYEHTLKAGPRKGQTETRYNTIEMESAWDAVVSSFEKAGQNEEDALLQARLARILRYEDYDFKKKKVKLWTPESLK